MMLNKLKLTKIDLYIIKKFLGTYFYTIILIIGIAIIFDFSEKIDDFMDKHAPMKNIIFDYYLNFIPYYANLFSNLFTFIAVIFFTSKMAVNSEIIAIKSIGFSFRRLLYPYFISASVIALLSLYLGCFVIPISTEKKLEFENKFVRNPYRFTQRNIHKQIEPGTYIYLESYTNEVEVGYKFSLEKFDKGILKKKIIADYIQWDTTKQQWKVHNFYTRTIDGDHEHVVKGAELDTTLRITPAEFHRRFNIVETMNYNELNSFIAEEKLRGSDTIEVYLVEKYKRFAFPFSTFILTVIGMSLASNKVRGGMGLHIGLGLTLSFTYIFFMQISTQFAIGGSVDPMIAVWIPNIIYGVIALFLYNVTKR